MTPAHGYLTFVLHCHLPFVRHPEHDQFLEEKWLFEAVTETYLPVLEVFQDLVDDGVPLQMTVSVSPPLMAMLSDDMLQERCADYVSDRVELMEKELERIAGSPFEPAAELYHRRFTQLNDRYGERPCEAFIEGLRGLQNAGHLEVITSAATHAVLPLLSTPEATRAQIEHGCRVYEHHFGRRPKGFWLPECAWCEDLDEKLAAAGLEFFFLESHGVLLADPRPVHGVFAPVVTPAGLTGFGRDVESSKQVWSADEGYPGDFDYREFHRDLGYDAPYDHIAPYLDPWGDRHQLGVKYHRITGDVSMEEKEPYDPEAARKKAEDHAEHFLTQRLEQIDEVEASIGRPPVIVAPYDAELFGHWWFEGPHFLESLYRLMASESRINPATAVGYLADNPVQQRAMPSTSTWGFEGYFDVWVNGSNDWMYRHLHRAEAAMVELAETFPDAEGLRRRALNQCGRELMLAESSDWAFLISTEGAPEYARERFESHMERFWRLHDQIRGGSIDETTLSEIQHRDNLFEQLDYRLYAAS